MSYTAQGRTRKTKPEGERPRHSTLTLSRQSTTNEKMGLHAKKKSKRITLKDRYKIERKVKEHNRKQRRQAKKDDKSGATARRALRKDPGIPKLWPEKEALLRQIEAKKERDEERKQARKEEIKKRRAGPTEEDLANAAERAEEHAMKEEESAMGEQSGQGGKHAGAVLKSVVEEADVILQVLDARDPQGCRSPQIEDLVRSKGKKMILVLNKTDLVPESAIRGWVRALKREYPTVPFAANTSKDKVVLRRAPGVDNLIKVLKKIAKGSKATLVVGVVGAPNVGKSSLVNSMKMARAVIASAQAGSTKTNQRVSIDSKLDIIDTPGVSTPFDPAKVSKAVAALRACLEPIVEDPIKAVEDLVRESPQERFMVAYGLPKFDSPRDFLVRLATQTGKMSKGGVLNLEAAAKLVVHDCQKGKFKLFCQPPELGKRSEEDMEEEDDAEVMDSLGAEFQFPEEDETMGL